MVFLYRFVFHDFILRGFQNFEVPVTGVRMIANLVRLKEKSLMTYFNLLSLNSPLATGRTMRD